MLLDSANLQERDAIFLNKRAWRKRAVLGKDAGETDVVEPLYTSADAEQTLRQFQRVLMHTPTEVGPGLVYETFDAGHMLGSTSMILQLREAGRSVRLLFSGDVGRVGLPITPDPDPAPPADYLILESTYGDRLHQDMGRVLEKLEDTVNRTCARGGRIIAPAFAVGRTQQIVLMLHQLMNERRIPSFQFSWTARWR
jgi:Predicted exonuclease of the beta-lactamase fold involved in RNA processing